MTEAILSPNARMDRELTTTVRNHLSMTYSQPGSHRMESLRNHDLDEELRAIDVPTLLLYGSDDPIVVPESGRFIADRIPGAELAVLDGARHGLSFEFREQTARLMSDFVLTHPLPGSAVQFGS